MNSHLSEEKIAGFLDGKLPLQERKEIENHLRGCDECLSEIIELESIKNEKWLLPKEFIKLARGGNAIKRKSWLLYVLETAAIFLIAVLLGYQFLFKAKPPSGRVTYIIDENRTPTPGMTVSPQEGNLDSKNEKKEKGSFKELAAKKRSVAERLSKSLQDKLRSIETKIEGLKEEQKLEDEEMREKKDEKETMKKKEPAQGVKGQINVQVLKNIFPTPAGPSNTQQNLQNFSQTTHLPVKCFVLEGDATESDIMNPQVICDLVEKMESIVKDINLFLEVKSDGKVIQAYGESSIKDDSIARLIETAKKLVFSSSNIEIRKIKIMVLKKTAHSLKESLSR